jgi:hypothetical protein
MVAALTLTASVAATSAASADQPDCSVVDVSPSTVAVGITDRANVTWDVGTDCDEDADVNWYLTFVIPGADYYGSGPMLANFQPPWYSKYSYIPDGKYVWQVSKDAYAGPYDVYVNAFVGDDTGDYLPAQKQTVNVLHRTTFGSTFNASPEPRRVGDKLNITGDLMYANWDTQKYQGFGEYVTLQFRPLNSDDYQDVKRVWDNGVAAKTSVRVTKSGTWRYHYEGDPGNKTAPSNSKGDTVMVTGH